MSLRKLGFSDVLLAVDGTQCVAAVEAEQAAGRGDMLLILMDASMEPMDGLEATRIIRQRLTPRGAGSDAGAAAAVFFSSPSLVHRGLLSSAASSPCAPLRTLRRFSPPYIIAQTANVALEAQRACLTAGADHFLPKPVRLDALVAALKLGHRALEQYRNSHVQKQSDSIASSLFD